MFNSINKEGITLSIRNGLYLPFMYKGRQVIVHNAAWSFREKIWVDDELVVNRVAFSMTSTHEIEVAGDKLRVTFGYRNRMKEIFVEAAAGEETVYELSHQVGKDIKPSIFAIYIAVSVLAGAALGYLVARLTGSFFGGA